MPRGEPLQSGEMPRKINLGCGNDYRDGWLNIDSGECKTDINMDIESMRSWYDRLPENYFEHIEAIQVLEHLHKDRFPHVLRAMYRVSKPGATWYFVVPHGFSDNFITDPTHKMPFSTRTFDYFCEGEQLRENGRIYRWGDICLKHIERPVIDGNQSIHFRLQVVK
jgi:hypothetical protein